MTERQHLVKKKHRRLVNISKKKVQEIRTKLTKTKEVVKPILIDPSIQSKYNKKKALMRLSKRRSSMSLFSNSSRLSRSKRPSHRQYKKSQSHRGASIGSSKHIPNFSTLPVLDQQRTVNDIKAHWNTQKKYWIDKLKDRKSQIQSGFTTAESNSEFLAFINHVKKGNIKTVFLKVQKTQNLL